ncbi:MAG: ABC transporter ATP-binding protein [Actinobacteria bacterium]|nr:MAG: ABC transporter ATP-binding protein [Actinomycetota bacterium]
MYPAPPVTSHIPDLPAHSMAEPGALGHGQECRKPPRARAQTPRVGGGQRPRSKGAAVIRSLRRIFKLYRPYRAQLILSQVLLLLSAICAIGMAALNGRIINDGLLAKNTEVVITTGIWMAVLALLSGVFMAGTATLAVLFAQGTGYAMRTMAYDQIQRFTFGNFDTFRTGNLLVRLSADVLNVQNAVMYALMLVLWAPFMVLTAFTLALLTSPGLVWILLVASALVLGTMGLFAPRIDKAYIERQSRLDEVNNLLQENLAGVRVVKAFTREDLESWRFEQSAAALRRPAFTAAFSVALLTPLLNVFTQLGTAATLWFGGNQVLDATGMTVGQISAFMQYLSLVVAPLALLAIVIPFVLRGEASASRIYEVIDTEPALADSGEHAPDAVTGRVTFEDVSFSFAGEGGQDALKGIDLDIAPGETIGILGATGAGKTALVNLVARFYDATGGRVLLDGVDVRDYSIDRLQALVGVTLQEAVLFEGDLRMNLKFASPEASDDVMIDAARAGDSFEFVRNLPEGWEAPVSRRGYNFSGGQRQRLSMTRTLVAEPDVLILDDSTSALDVATEARVQEAIPEFARDVTTIYVAQRISAVMNLDRIVLMDAGRIVDVGSHDDLMSRSELYRQIFESQLGADVLEGTD